MPRTRALLFVGSVLALLTVRTLPTREVVHYVQYRSFTNVLTVTTVGPSATGVQFCPARTTEPPVRSVGMDSLVIQEMEELDMHETEQEERGMQVGTVFRAVVLPVCMQGDAATVGLCLCYRLSRSLPMGITQLKKLRVTALAR